MASTTEWTPAAPNQVGNLWLKGGNVALGWNDEQATKETFVDGWLKTGDKFWVDEDGYF
jgi:long-subunit acyl-CoA synthetase (AMP-forming)